MGEIWQINLGNSGFLNNCRILPHVDESAAACSYDEPHADLKMNPMQRLSPFGLMAWLLALVFGWGLLTAPAAYAATAESVITDTDSGEVLAIAELEDTSEGLAIEVSFLDAPSGTHGFHIHENGSCAESGKAAGGHYNPDGVKHGKLLEDGFEGAHAGDLGNVVIGDTGEGIYSALIPGLSLEEGSYAVGNRTFILHAQPDDFGQPTGNAGARVGCGVIELN